MNKEEMIKKLQSHFNLRGKSYKPDVYGNFVDCILPEIKKAEKRARVEVANNLLNFTKPWIENCIEFPSMVAYAQRKILEMYERRFDEIIAANSEQ